MHSTTFQFDPSKTRAVRIYPALLSVIVLLSMANFATAQTSTTFDEHTRSYTYRLKITPAAEMTPKFRYRFSVPVPERVAGNAAMHYARSFGENQLSRIWKSLQDEFGDEVRKWPGQEIPIHELPIEKALSAAAAFDDYIEQFIDRATRCRDCDWGLAEETFSGLEFYRLLLPEVQSTREIARALMLRARVAIADRRYDDAIEPLKMCYQLGRNVGQLKFLVAMLVANAEMGMANGVLIELIGSPDSPNMYWALAELPTPLIDMREAFQLEYNTLDRLFPDLKNIEQEEKTDEQWQTSVAEVIDVMLAANSLTSSMTPQSDSTEQNSLVSSSLVYAMAITSYPSAKKRLADSGVDKIRLETMPVGQALLWDMKNEMTKLSHNGESILYLPFPEALIVVEKFEGDLAKNENSSLGYKLAGTLFPAIQQVRAAQVRIERQRNALMVIEAIRMHLFHVGSIPKTLEQITMVPIPLNPATGQSFDYSVDGKTMILELPRSDGATYWTERFEIEVVEQ